MEVVTLGEAMVLMLAEPGLPLAAATRYRRSVAGAESNVAIGLARLNHTVGWIGRVGDDPFGRTVLGTLRAEGVDVSHARFDPAPTGLLVRDCVPERPIDVVYHRAGSAGSRLDPGDVDGEYIGAARVVHVSGVTALLGERPRAAALRAAEIGRKAGALVSFDPNVRRRLATPDEAAERLRPFAEFADVVLAGEDEARLLSGEDDPEGAAEWFLARGARLVAIKCGARGSWATDGSQRWTCAALPVVAVDPVGAGDAFAAGLISALLRERPTQEALQEATIVASLCIQVPTDVDGLPSARERDALMAGELEVRR